MPPWTLMLRSATLPTYLPSPTNSLPRERGEADRGFFGRERSSALLFFGRQRDTDGGAAARAALYRQPSAMGLDQAFGDRQPEPGAAVVSGGGGLCLTEGLQGALLLFLVHADPVILELHDGDAGRIDAGSDEDLAPGLGELYRVGKQVEKHLLDRPLVRPDAEFLLRQLESELD